MVRTWKIFWDVYVFSRNKNNASGNLISAHLVLPKLPHPTAVSLTSGLAIASLSAPLPLGCDPSHSFLVWRLTLCKLLCLSCNLIPRVASFLLLSITSHYNNPAPRTNWVKVFACFCGFKLALYPKTSMILMLNAAFINWQRLPQVLHEGFWDHWAISAIIGQRNRENTCQHYVALNHVLWWKYSLQCSYVCVYAHTHKHHYTGVPSATYS